MLETMQEVEQKARGASAVDNASLSTLFLAVCAQYGSRTAVTMGDESISYAELKGEADRVAGALLAENIPAGSLVAIYMERSIGLVAAMLGVIRAGCAYLPLDASYPVARVLETIDDARPAAVLTDGLLSKGLESLEVPVIIAEKLSATDVTAAVDDKGPARDLAYVIYTSGSTGRPKGVMVTQHNVIRLFTATHDWFQFNEHDVWTMFHSFAFDFSVWEMWGPLLTGGRLVLVPFTVSRSPEEFYALLASERVTVLNQTPSAFSLLIQAEARVPVHKLALRLVIFGGEALNLRSLLPWFGRHGDSTPQLINMYGITETTVHVTYRRILTVDAELETDSLIGEPIPDLQMHLLDEHLLPVVEGATGEICIGGAGVASGYLGRPELTSQRFIADPFAQAGGRLYRSGDLARRRTDGELVYLGRADHQVKINGFRIELGEIEAALLEVPGVIQACVTTHTAAGEAARLAAYFVADLAISDTALRTHLAQHLPAQMRPSFFKQLGSMPMTGNGKVDRAALPSPVAAESKLIPATTKSPMESVVAAAWSKALGLTEIGSEENFFDVGGTSLLLIAVRTALQQELNRPLPVTWFFEHTTIRSLAVKLTEDEHATVSVTNTAHDKALLQRNAFARMKAARSAAR